MEKMRKETVVQQIFDAVSINEDFGKALLMAEDADSAKNVLNANGFDITVEDVEAIFKDGLDEILKFKESGVANELSDNQLDNVAGGGVIRGTLRTAGSAIAGFGFGMFCGICPAAATATPYVVGGLAVWSAAGYMKKGW